MGDRRERDYDRQDRRAERWAIDSEVAALEAERQRREELAAERRVNLRGFLDYEGRIGTYADMEQRRREEQERRR